MQANSFNDWKNNPVTVALLKFLQQHIEGEKQGIPTWDDIEHPERLAYKMGQIHAWELILRIDKEDLKEDESESAETLR